MANQGIAPPDLGTPVGKFRQTTHDLAYVDLEPPVAGQGDYTVNSDEEIEGWLARGGDSLSRGLGYFFQALAGQAALTASNITDTDLKVQTEKRAELISRVADQWFARADAEDLAAGTTDIFDTFRFNGDLYPYPEAAAYPYDEGY